MSCPHTPASNSLEAFERETNSSVVRALLIMKYRRDLVANPGNEPLRARMQLLGKLSAKDFSELVAIDATLREDVEEILRNTSTSPKACS